MGAGGVEHDAAEAGRMQAAVRTWVLRTASGSARGLRALPPRALLSLLCAAALSPVLAAGAGLGAVALAGTGVLSSVGSSVLSEVIASALARTRSKGGHSSAHDLDAEVAHEIERVLAAQDAHAAALRAEIGKLLRQIDAGGAVIQAAMEQSDERVRGDVIAALEVLSSSFSETRFLINDVIEAAAQIQRSLDEYGANIRAIVEQNDRQSTDIRLVREDLAAIERRSGGEMPATAPGNGAGPLWARGCPYRGLLPFEETDADVFYGRERLTAELAVRLAARTARGGVLLVTGASGAGKSSLLRAGLLPMLARGQQVEGSDRWARITMTPTKDPLAELASRLAALGGGDFGAIRDRLRLRPHEAHMAVWSAVLADAARREQGRPSLGDGDARLVLIIDQFEQVFTLKTGPDAEAERQAFVSALGAAATNPAGSTQEPPALVVIAVRGDFWDRCAGYPEVTDALKNGPFVLGPMTGSELRLAITGPAEAAGLEVDPGLPDTILGDLRAAGGGDAGVLPLLSQAMSLTWEERDGNRLTSHGYALTGGVTRAVQTGADAVYDALPAGQQALARELLRVMTVTARDGRISRRPVTRADLYAGHLDADRSAIDAVLEKFAQARLIVIDGEAVQIAHDALLSAWPRLRGWLEEDQASWILHGQLADDAAAWHDSHDDSSFLYRGAQLTAVRQAASTWSASPARYPALTGTQHDFLTASQRAAARSARQRRMVITALVLLLMVAAAGAGLAGWAAANANAQHNQAVAAQLASESEALDTANPVTAAQLAAAAWQVDPTPQARDGLLNILAQPDRGVFDGSAQALTEANAMAFSPDGKLLAVGVGDEAVLLNVATRAQVGKPMSFGGPGNPVTSLAFSPDGKILATNDGGAIFLWNVATQAKIGVRLVRYGSPMAELSFSPDGKTLATVTVDGYVQFWNVATHAQIGGGIQVASTGSGQLGGCCGIIQPQAADDISFSPSGKTFVTAGGQARVWDTATRTPIGAPVTLTGGENALVISPNGKLVATGDNTGHVQLWNLATGRLVGAPLGTGSEVVDAIAFNAQNTTLAVANEDGAVTLWNVATRTEIGAPLEAGVVPSALAFNPAGTILASSDDKSAPILWDVAAWHQLGPPLNIGDAYTVAFSPGATEIAAIANDQPQNLQVWDLPAGTSVGTLPATNVQAGVVRQAEVFSRDGKILATEDSGGDIEFWDAATLAKAGGLSSGPLYTYASQLAFSPDGKTMVTSQPVQFWNVATRSKIGRPLSFGSNEYPVDDLAFSPDGKILATATQLGALRLWNAESHAAIGAPLTTSDADEAAFSPNGQELAAGDKSGTAQLWDVATRTPIGPPLDAGDVYQLAFSPNGQFLATATSSGTIQLWDAVTGAAIGAPLTTGTGEVLGLAFNADGSALVTATSSAVQLWDVSFPADLTAAVCGIAGGPLTQAEWKYYIPSEPYQSVCTER